MLNAEQKRAVKAADGPCLIIAGAGTGKTRTIVEKLAHLVKEGVDPVRILALTFSNEAAGQMKERAERLMPQARYIRISTFHSFCADFIRSHARECGVNENFKILEELDAAIMLKRQLNLDVPRAKRYANTIGKAKDLSLGMDDYSRYISDQENLLAQYFPVKNLSAEYDRALIRLRTGEADRGERKKLAEFVRLHDNYVEYRSFVDVWKRYEMMKKKGGMLDYADLNSLVLEYAGRYGSDELADSFDYIVVDEFQDTNKVQFDLLSHLTARKRNVTVVGDQNQTVYAFRGAYADNIEKFRKAFRVKDVVKMKANYRSTNTILRTAHNLIRNNYARPDDSVLLEAADSEEGTPVGIIQLEDSKEQARRVVEEIEKLGIGYRDVAVLYRSHSSASAVKRALQQRGIPYSTAGSADFFYVPEIKTAVSFLYVLNNFTNTLLQADQAWWKLLHDRFGLSAADSTKLAEFRKKKHISLQLVLYDHLENAGLSSEGIERIESLKSVIDSLRKKSNQRLSDLLLAVYEETGMARYGDREKMVNLKQLYYMARDFETFHGSDLADFITYIEMIDEMGGGFPSAKALEEDSVKLMTIHAAKGLEFSAVFVIDMVKDKFPLTRGGVEPLIPMELNEQYDEVLSRSYKSEKEKEAAISEMSRSLKEKEERRLFYVALTRSKKSVFLTLAKDYGGRETRDPSSFLFEIGADPGWFSKDSASSPDLAFVCDREIRAKESGDTDLEREAAKRRKLMSSAVDMLDFKSAKYHMLVYQGLLAKKPARESSHLGRLAAREVTRTLKNLKDGKRGMKFNPSALNFSVTSIGTYLECSKKYELKHVLGMPSRDDEEGEGPMGFGSVIHDVLDAAAKEKVRTREELMKIFENKTKDIEGFDSERGRRVMDVFWSRHASSLKSAVETEMYFRFPLEGFMFSGKIDRIDYLGGGKVRIIDYKTGYTNRDVPKDDRERQLLLYALAVRDDPAIAQNKWIPTELVLDMLEKEKPLEFTLESDVLVAPGRIKNTGVEDIKRSVVGVARQVARSYENGFAVAENDTPCRRCSYKLYCPKWG